MLVWHSYFGDRHVAGKKYEKSEVAILIRHRPRFFIGASTESKMAGDLISS